jgi:NADPH:quinone reductase-like Zn-dependent oxidoreductase
MRAKQQVATPATANEVENRNAPDFADASRWPREGTGEIPHRMRAVAAYAYGEADVLESVDIEVPAPGPNEVLVEIHAAGLHRGTWHLMSGLPYVIRLGFGFRRPKQAVQGDECSGVVVAVGDEVTAFHVGDQVLGLVEGSFAQYGIASEDKLTKKPVGISFVDAAAIPISAATALQAVRDEGQIRAGQNVLVVGASGAVGSYAVQFARHLGARVTGVCSGKKAEFVRSLGADEVVDYATKELDELDETYDVVIDIGGNRPTKLLRSILTPEGTVVFVGGEEGGKWIGGIQRQIGAALMSSFTKHDLKMMFSDPSGDDFAELVELHEAGAFEVPVDRTFELESAADAMRYLTSGRAKGKVVVAVEHA